MRISALVTATLVASLTPMCAQRYKNAKDALADGVRLYNENKIEGSLQALDAAVKLSAKPDPDVYNYRCMGNYLLKRYEPALGDCQQLTILRPSNESAWNNYGLVCQAVGQHERAIEIFGKAITINASNAKTLRNRASSYERLNRVQEALGDYSRALDLDSADVDTLVRRARLFNRMGDYQRAEQDAKAASSRDSKSAEALVELGDARLHQQRYDASISDFAEAISLTPGWAWPLVKRCEAYRALNEADKALGDCSDAIKKAPDVGYLFADRAEVYLALRRYQEALEDAESALLHGQKDAWAYDIEGRANQGLGHWDRSIRDFEEALLLEPNRADLYVHRARARRVNGDPEGSRKDLSAAQRLVHSNPSPSASVKRELAFELSASGNRDDALTLLEELRSGDPKDAQTLLQIAGIYRERRNYKEARRALDGALMRAPDSPDALGEQARLLSAERKFTEAMPLLRRAIDSTAKESYTRDEADHRSDLLVDLGLAYNALGEYDRAVETWRQLALVSPSRGAWAEQQMVLSWQAAGQTEKAQAASEAALKLYPDSPELSLTHADMLAKSGKLELAVADVRALLARKSDFEAWMELAALVERQNPAEASDAYEAAAVLALSPEQLSTLNSRRAGFLDRSNRVEAAETEYRQLLEREPDNAAAMNALASFYTARHIKLDEAERLFKGALGLDPENGVYYDKLGWLYFGKRQLFDAEKYLRLASDHRPHDPLILDHVAQLSAAQEKWKEAAASWSAALKEGEAAGTNTLGRDEVARIRKQLEDARTRAAKASARPLTEKR